MFKKKWLILILCLCCLGTQAQHFNFKHYQQKQGLATSSVKYIFQDSYGFIWFATQGGGVSRFDGKGFVSYSKQDGLVGNDVTCISEDRDHNIWIGTVDGVSKFDRKHFVNYTTENGLKENKVFNILCDDSKIWISTFGGGIAILENGKFSYFNTDNGLSSNKIFTVFKDKINRYWIGTSKGGINIYNGKSFTVVKESKNFNSASAFCFYEASDGKIWIGTPGKGIFYIQNNEFHQLDIPLINTDYISKIVEDKQHNLWCATEHGLLKVLSNGAYKFFDKRNGLSVVDIPSVLSDYEGNIWVSCFTDGVYKLTNEAFSVFTVDHGLNENRVVSFCKKDKGLLLGTTNGLNYLKGDSISAIKLPAELSGVMITALLYENKTLYVGTDSKGVYQFQETEVNQFKLLKKINQLNGIEIKTVVTNITKFKDKEDVWVSLYGNGLLKISGSSYSLFNTDNGKLPSNDVACIFADESDLWIGTIGLGVLKMNTNDYSVHQYSKADNFTSTSVFSINKSDSRIIVGSVDEGLFLLEKDKFINISKKQGLISNVINAVFSDKENELWLGTDLGINKITLDGIAIKSIKTFTDEDGLRSTEIEQNAIIANQGNIYFGTNAGLVVYNVKEDLNNPEKPKLIIDELVLKYGQLDSNNVKFDSLSKLGLPINPVFNYKQNDLTFKFKALSPQIMYYSFFLEGYDQDWSAYQINNEAIFTNLPHGKYVLKIKAVNKNGVESRLVEYPFEITPPFYLRWWFFVLSIIVLSASVFSFIKYRTHKLIKEKQVLESKVQERTVELKTANTSLNVALDEIKDSINYAQRIQSSILPDNNLIERFLPDSFILYNPRDVVSGDFYWFNKVEDKIIFAVVDCTGHGVPGALMSMIGNSVLNEIILTKKVTSPSMILSQLNKGIFKLLKQGTSESRDGMDLALCMIDTTARTLTFAGANRELIVIRNGNLTEYKPTKNAIGGFTDANTVFPETVIEIEENDVFYMSTDGYADQFGGPKGKKLMTKNFKDFLLKIHQESFTNQKHLLQENIISWMGDQYGQVDDILVAGFKFNA